MMVLLVLLALAIIGTPFVISMAFQEKAAIQFEGGVKARVAAEGARNHAVARLHQTHRAVESEIGARGSEKGDVLQEYQEAGLLAAESSETAVGVRARSRTERRRTTSRTRSRRGTVIREDLGEGIPGASRRGSRSRRNGRTLDEDSALPGMIESRVGPPEESFDEPSEIASSLPAHLDLPDRTPVLSTALPEEAAPVRSSDRSAPEPDRVVFRDPRGVYATARVIDEQGKVNINSAPPNVIAALFGVSELKQRLDLRDDEIVLEDASQFRTDGNPDTIDGAVVITRKGSLWGEVITYQDRRGNSLRGIFRGAFFSVPAGGKEALQHPEGSLVWDLRGWKVAFHRLRAGSVRGFATDHLHRFQTIESIREIANWQIASLFLERFRGEGLTREFLASSGIRDRELAEAGLDGSLFESEKSYETGFLREQLDQATSILSRKRLGSFTRKLKKAMGPRAVIEFANRVEPLSAREAGKLADELEEGLAKRQRKPARFDPDYLKACLANLGKVIRTRGIETITPEEFEHVRELITVNSRREAEWSEAQTVEGEISSSASVSGEKQSLQVPRPGYHGGGALLRLRHRDNPDRVEYNISQGGGPKGFFLLFPTFRSYGPREALVEFHERHPVNVNTAPRRVLEAVLTGVTHIKGRGARKSKEEFRENESPGLILPSEARALASAILSRRPLRSVADYQAILEDAIRSEQLDPLDAQALLANAIQPNHDSLAVSSLGFCYDFGDVYTVESRGLLRNEAGGEIYRTSFRELVSVAPPRPLRQVLFHQADFTTELFLRDPSRSVPSMLSYPEDHFYNAVSFPGRESHLVRSTPVQLKFESVVNFNSSTGTRAGGNAGTARATLTTFPLAGGDPGTLELESGETWPSEFSARAYGVKDIYHFRKGRGEALDLPGGEPWPLDISIGGGGQGGRGGGGGVSTSLDLTNVPASVEAWVRFRTFPQATSRDGHLILMDAGVEETRNRISLLYDRGRQEWVARMFDSSLPDPTIAEGEQKIEVRARKPLELSTWYHVKIAWDGMFRGGLGLFIDGFPVGRSNFETQLAGDFSISSKNLPLERSDLLPREGVVRVGSELVEVRAGRVREEAPSNFQKWLVQQNLNLTANTSAPGGVVAGTPAASIASSLQPSVKRGVMDDDAGNRRGTVRTDHRTGTPVGLHGYALEVVRKGKERHDRPLCQVPDGRLILGQGGLHLAEDILPFRFPPGVIDLVHFNPDDVFISTPAGEAPAGESPASPTTGVMAPVFRLENPRISGRVSAAPCPRFEEAEPVLTQKLRQMGWPPGFVTEVVNIIMEGAHIYSSKFQWGSQQFDAADFFQSRGVVRGGANYRYQKRTLPSGHLAMQAQVYVWAEVTPGNLQYIPIEAWNPQTQRLFFVSIDTDGNGQIRRNRIGNRTMLVLCEEQTVGLGLQSLFPQGQIGDRRVDHGERLRLNSILASGPVENAYPSAGLIEMRGSPPPWQQPQRTDLRGSDVFSTHPDDSVEWLRYHWVENDLFIYPGGSGGHRDYPRGWNHMYHRGARPPGLARTNTQASFGGRGAPRGEPLRQVVELMKGDAGFGDYVSIVTDDPQVYEPETFRVFKTLERDDGRFFISLYAAGDGQGYEALRFQNAYVKNDNNLTKIVKFPSGSLPKLAGGRLVVFGDAVRGTSGGNSLSSAGLDDGEEPTTGHVIDEVRLTANPYYREPSLMRDSTRLKYVVVPLEGGRVKRVQTQDGGEALTGAIPESRTISRSNPLEILVVAVGERSEAFAPAQENGVLKINDEYFFFENPNARTEGGNSAQRGGASSAIGAGSLQGVQPVQTRQTALQNSTDLLFGGQSRPDNRTRRWTIRSNASGSFEQEGFARIRYAECDLAGFREIFYYQARSGGTFNNCLRGQFSTSLHWRERYENQLQRQQELQEEARAGNVNLNLNPFQGSIRNITTRIRLVGRSLLGSPRQTHGFGDPLSLVFHTSTTEIQGPMTDVGIPVLSTRGFPGVGYLLMDSARGDERYELIAYTGRLGENQFRRPLDELGRGICRASFGTVPLGVGRGMFAHAMPFRHFDRYQAGVDSPHLAYFQRSFREPGALWRRISWKERERTGRNQGLTDIVVAVRFDGAADWSVEPTNKPDGLYLIEGTSSARGRLPTHEFGVVADQMDVRVYFRYKTGAFQRIGPDHFRDDWKESPVLESLVVEYEKAGRVLRREEADF